MGAKCLTWRLHLVVKYHLGTYISKELPVTDPQAPDGGPRTRRTSTAGRCFSVA